MIAAVSARRGRHCPAVPGRCPGRRHRHDPCRGIYLSGRGATLSWPRPRGEEHYLDAVAAMCDKNKFVVIWTRGDYREDRTTA